MYPLRRLTIEALRAARMPPLAPGEAHVSKMLAWPWDIDPFGDLNNGRILTLMDTSRVALTQRIGLVAAMRRRRWGLALAGSAPQYRKRVTVFQPLELRARLIARDQRFLYVEQSIYVRGAPTSNMVCRLVLTSRKRQVPTDEVAAEIGHPGWNPPAPAWVQAWAEAERLRPWPPEPMV